MVNWIKGYHNKKEWLILYTDKKGTDHNSTFKTINRWWRY